MCNKDIIINILFYYRKFKENMGQYVRMKHALNIMRIKYSLAGRRERFRLEVDSIQEHLKLFQNEIEIASGKTINELLNGNILEYNNAIVQTENKQYMLDRMGISRNNLLYRNEDLRQYLDIHGTLDQKKAQKRIEEIENHPLIVDVKIDQKVKVLNRIFKENVDNRKYEAIDREDLKVFFPGFKNIEQYPGSNIIFLEHEEYEWDTLDEESVISLRNDTSYLDRSTYKLTQEGKEILEESSDYLERHNVDENDPYAYMEWYYEKMKEASNYHAIQISLARGSQYYINKCIDSIEDDNIKQKVKKYSFTTIISIVCPVGPNIESNGGWAENITYEEPQNRQATYNVYYEDQEYIQKLISTGKKVNIIGIVSGKFEVVKKYNQD